MLVIRRNGPLGFHCCQLRDIVTLFSTLAACHIWKVDMARMRQVRGSWNLMPSNLGRMFAALRKKPTPWAFAKCIMSPGHAHFSRPYPDAVVGWLPARYCRQMEAQWQHVSHP
jgi:hypothetical protein